jgi:hypothetical protein
MAFACEGVGEESEAKISIKAIESGKGGMASGTGKCPENAKKEVTYKNLTEWCEYEVKNENIRAEEVEVRSENISLPKTGECWEKCLNPVAPGAGAECKENMTKLARNGKCYRKLEYITEPAKETEASSDVIVKATGGATGSAELKQLAK